MRSRSKFSKTARKEAEQFNNRVRFNWGYHDAAQTVREGWNNPQHNFGFACYGPLAGLTGPDDVEHRHFDSFYAAGWVAGYADAISGTYAKDSEAAWLRRNELVAA